MCGICGYIHLDSGKPSDRGILEAMTQTLQHRGPDGEGFHLYRNVALGHRRLSIIDLQSGDQPMVSADQQRVISFNGEIYNYIELREELKSHGYQFLTTSDTEVILQAWHRWGAACVEHFNGVWAFAILDKERDLVFLSRDRLGEKPLYYAVHNGTLVFGSEIKAILAYGVPPTPRMDVLDMYLSLGYLPSPFTFYSGVEKLPPASSVLVRNGSYAVARYWRFPVLKERDMIRDSSRVYQTFQELLNDSVKLRMRSDVPFGVFLSGGLDSSTILHLMTRNTSLPVNSFTIGFQEKRYDESLVAATTADLYGTKHELAIAESSHFGELTDALIYHFDEPFGDSSAIPTSLVSRLAGKKVKMVLTGDGGDEVLSGYTTYQGERFASYYNRLPGVVTAGLPGLIDFMGHFPGKNGQDRHQRIRETIRSSSLPFPDRLISKASWIPRLLLNNLLKPGHQYRIEDYFRDFFRDCTYQNPFYKLMYYNLYLSLPDDMLAKVDRMSMAHSLEARVPFLDHRLVEFMVTVDMNVKMPGFTRKQVLLQTVGRELPEYLTTIRKRGFVVPVRKWFTGDEYVSQKDRLLDLPFINREVMQEILEANRSGKHDYGNFLFMMLMLRQWYEKYR